MKNILLVALLASSGCIRRHIVPTQPTLSNKQNFMCVALDATHWRCWSKGSSGEAAMKAALGAAGPYVIEDGGRIWEIEK